MNTKARFPKNFSEKEKKQFDIIMKKLEKMKLKPTTIGAYKVGDEYGYAYYNINVPGITLLVQIDDQTNQIVHIMNALTNNILKSFI